MKVGRIKNIRLNDDDNNLELTIIITNKKFKKALLRDLSLAGNLIVDGEIIRFVSKENEKDA